MLNIFKPKVSPNFELLLKLELANVCRICLDISATASLLSIFDNEIDSLISEFLPQKLDRKPLQPHQICAKCFEEAKNAFIFKKQCEYSDELIKSMLNEPNIGKTCEKQTQTDFSYFMYPCEKCDEKFESFETLREHRLKEHYKTPNVCRKCDKIFSRIGTLRDHLRSVHPELGFSCNNKCHLCKKMFTQKKHLKRHLINMHKGKAIEKFLEKDNIKRKHEDPSKLVKDKCELSCEICLKNFEIEDDLKKHECPTIHERVIEMKSSNNSTLIRDSDKNKIDAHLISKEMNECNSRFENNFKPDVNINEKNKVELVVPQSKVEIKTVITVIPKKSKVTQEMVERMIAEPKKKISRTRVKTNANGRYECEICKKVFSRVDLLTRHQLLHSDDPKPYRCTMCSKSFSRSDHLKNHVNGFHADLRPFKCVTCEKTFKQNEHLKRHMNLLTCSTEIKRSRKEKHFSCEICMRKFSTEKYLQDHVSVQHNETKEFSCKYCSDKVIGATEYKKHCKVHYIAPPKEFLCSECGGSFSKLEYLIRHIRRHTGEKPYKCRYCDKAFPRTTDQYAHERLHTGEKNFQCAECSKAFSTGYKLRVHMRTHTGEVCSGWTKTLTSCTFLRGPAESVYILMKKRPYKCLYCTKAFAENSALKKHHRQHTGERFYCDLCGLDFPKSYGLRQHKREIHGINETRSRISVLSNDKDRT